MAPKREIVDPAYDTLALSESDDDLDSEEIEDAPVCDDPHAALRRVSSAFDAKVAHLTSPGLAPPDATAASVGDSFHDGLDCVVHAQNLAYNDEEDEDDSVLRPRRAERASAREERVKSVAMFAATAGRVGDVASYLCRCVVAGTSRWRSKTYF